MSKVWEHNGLTFISIISLVCTRYYVPRLVYFSFYVRTIHTCTHKSHTYIYINKHTYMKYIHTYIFFIWDMCRRGETHINRDLIARFVLPDAGVKLTIFESLTATWAIGWPALKCNVSLGTGQKSCLHGTYHGYIAKPINRHYLTGTKPVNFNWAVVQMILQHDDVIKWKHFHVTGYLCGAFTGPWRISHTKTSDVELWFFSLICAWINGWVNNGEIDDLTRHLAHYDVTVMGFLFISDKLRRRETHIKWSHGQVCVPRCWRETHNIIHLRN